MYSRISFRKKGLHADSPDQAQRKLLWEKLILKELPHNVNFFEISQRFEGLSGSDISNAVLMAAFAAARKNESVVSNSYFEEAIQNILKSKKENKGDIKVTDRIVTEDYVKSKLN